MYISDHSISSGVGIHPCHSINASPFHQIYIYIYMWWTGEAFMEWQVWDPSIPLRYRIADAFHQNIYFSDHSIQLLFTVDCLMFTF